MKFKMPEVNDFIDRLSLNDNYIKGDGHANLSSKYQTIENASGIIAGSSRIEARNIRTWKHQDDMGVPVQVRRFMELDVFTIENLFRFVYGFTPEGFLKNRLKKQALLDDLRIIEKYGYLDLLRKFPVDKTPLVRDIYRRRGVSFNLKVS